MAQQTPTVSLEQAWKMVLHALAGRNGAKITEAKSGLALIDWRMKHS